MSARLPIVTLDGPAGVGKTTLARRMAESLGLAYLDTGAMFRCMALKLGPGAEKLPEDELRSRCGQWTFTLSGMGQQSTLFCNGVAVRAGFPTWAAESPRTPPAHCVSATGSDDGDAGGIAAPPAFRGRLSGAPHAMSPTPAGEASPYWHRTCIASCA